MLSRADEPGCLSTGFVQGFFHSGMWELGVHWCCADGVWRCAMIPLGYPDLGGWGHQGTAPLQ